MGLKQLGPWSFRGQFSTLSGSPGSLNGRPCFLARAALAAGSAWISQPRPAMAFVISGAFLRAAGLVSFYFAPRRSSAAPRLFKTPAAARGGKHGLAPAGVDKRIEKFGAPRGAASLSSSISFAVHARRARFTFFPAVSGTFFARGGGNGCEEQKGERAGNFAATRLSLIANSETNNSIKLQTPKP